MSAQVCTIGSQILQESQGIIQKLKELEAFKDKKNGDLLELILDPPIEIIGYEKLPFPMFQQVLDNALEVVSCYLTMKKVFEVLTGQVWGTAVGNDVNCLVESMLHCSGNTVFGIQYKDHGFVLIVRADRQVELIESIAGHKKIVESLVRNKTFNLEEITKQLLNLSSKKRTDYDIAEAYMGWNWGKEGEGLIGFESANPFTFSQSYLRTDWKDQWTKEAQVKAEQLIHVAKSFRLIV